MKSEAYITEHNGVHLIRFPHFTEAGLCAHGITTRKGGVSEGFLASLNMGRKMVDSPRNIAENRRRAAEAIGVSPDSFVFSDQVHGVGIREVNRDNYRDPISETDGLMTDVPGITLVTFYADCMPVMIYDPEHQAIGMVHAGWRGTAAGIAPLLVEAMVSRYGSRPQAMLAAMGPAIGPCCFEVGLEVAEAFMEIKVLREETSWLIPKPGNPHLDLGMINFRLLTAAGIPDTSVINPEICTCCHPELLYSHRRDHGDTGRMAALMALQE